MEYGDKLNAISLFSGIGGFELGLHNYCRTLLYCEADKHAQAVLLSRMSERAIDKAPICTDVREINSEFVDMPIDIIFGGFPCQDVSVAGKGVGLEGERSGLFFEIVRLAGEIKPTFLFLENVSAIRTRGLDRVILELTEVGYDLRWCMLSASDVGAPHRRERWFLLAARRDALANPESICDRGELRDILSENAEIGRSEEQYQDQTRESESASELSTVLANTDQPQYRLSERETKAHTITRECSQNQTGTLADTFCEGIRSDSGIKAETIRVLGEGLVSGAEQLANTDNERLEGSETPRDIESRRKNTDQQPTRCSSELANTTSERLEGSDRTCSEQYATGCGSECSPRPTESNMGRMADGFSSDVVEIRRAHLDPNYWKEEPEGVPRVTEEREQRVDRIKRLGNAVVPLQVRTAFEYLMGIYKENNPNLVMPMPLVIPKPKPAVGYEEVEW